MALQCDEKSILHLFKEYSILEIPMYQRSYAWNKAEVVNFRNDLKECLLERLKSSNKHHFFGSVLSITSVDSTLINKKVEIIDGQQRLTTFVLLVSVVVNKLRRFITKNKSQLSASQVKKLKDSADGFNREYILFKDTHDTSSEEQLKLQTTSADTDFFVSLIKNGLESEVKASKQSHERLKKAWLELEKFVDDVLINSESSEAVIRNLTAFREILGIDCTIIFIGTTNSEDAYRYFQVLNDRGVRLTTGDLLRAHTLGLISRHATGATADNISRSWNEILKDSQNDVERHLKWYYESLTGSTPKKLNLTGQYIEEIFCIDQIKDKKGFVATLQHRINLLWDGVSAIRRLRNGEWDGDGRVQINSWDKERLRSLVVGLRHTNSMSLLLALTEVDLETFYQSVAVLERFVLRFKTIGQSHVGKMEEIYLKFCKLLRSEPTLFAVQNFRDSLETLMLGSVSDKVFRARLDALLYEERSAQRKDALKIFFIMLENYAKWEESKSNSMPICKDKTNIIDYKHVSLEHIYPQSAKPNSIDFSLEPLKHNIGNLTILGPSDNSVLSNKSFDKKKEMFEESNIRLNRSVGKRENWTVENVRERQSELIEKAVRIVRP